MLQKQRSRIQGLNGDAFFYGQDLVVKKYYPKEKAGSYNPDREITSMDTMFDMGVKCPNVQRGKFAFTSPENEIYLVSTKISGQNPNSVSNMFNEDNLSGIVQIIGKLDTPIEDKTKKQSLLPYIVPIHYDLTTGNINITENDGGIFDFEYLGTEDMDKRYFDINNPSTTNITDTIMDFSDIAGIVSNLRNFEYRGLLKYLRELPKEEAEELFKTYIQIKSNYHSQRADFFEQEALNLQEKGKNKQVNILKELAEKENAHSLCLKNANSAILKVEAIKIQIASFLYILSNFSHSLQDKVNPKQILNYISNAKKYFNEQYEKTDNSKEKIYFEDCKNLMKSWSFDNVKGWMHWQNTNDEPDIQNLFKSKLTDETVKTLDEIVCN